MKKVFLILVLSFSVFIYGIIGCSKEKTETKAQTASKEKTELTVEVSELFNKHCSVSGCHQGAYPKKKLNLESDTFESAIIDVVSLQVDSLKLVDTTHPEKSYLLVKVKGGENMVGDLMPEEAPPLQPQEIEIIENWIIQLHESKAETKDAPQAEENN